MFYLGSLTALAVAVTLYATVTHFHQIFINLGSSISKNSFVEPVFHYSYSSKNIVQLNWYLMRKAFTVTEPG